MYEYDLFLFVSPILWGAYISIPLAPMLCVGVCMDVLYEVKFFICNI